MSPYLLYKQRVGRQLEGLRTMRLQAERLPNPMDRGRRMAHRFRHGLSNGVQTGPPIGVQKGPLAYGWKGLSR